jgi:hypothetical protein
VEGGEITSSEVSVVSSTAKVKSSGTPEPGEPDVKTVAGWLSVLLADDQIFELRAVKVEGRNGFTQTEAGFFDRVSIDKAAELALDLTRRAHGVYFTINPLKKDILARCKHRVKKADENGLTKDNNVLMRRFLYLDFDPVKDALVSASEEEKAKAAEVCIQVLDYLDRRGWPAPIREDTGNGFALFYRIDLPADDAGLVKSVIEVLALHFDTAEVKIDRTVFNPSRISKIPGTLARKGDDCPDLDRPHRRSRLIDIPGAEDAYDWNNARLEVVSEQQMKELVGELAPSPVEANGTVSSNGKNGSGFSSRLKVEEYLSAKGIGFRRKSAVDQHGRIVWQLDACPFDPSHRKPDSAVFQDAHGKLGFHCFHNSCAGRGWKEFTTRVGKPEVHHYDPPLTRGPRVGGFGSGEQAQGHQNGASSGGTNSPQQGSEGLVCVTLSSVLPQPVRFLVDGFFALGKITLIAGDGARGKTSMLNDVIACVTTGRPALGLTYVPPDPLDVLILSAEDDAADMIVPRLLAAGADLQRVHLIKGIKSNKKDGKPEPFNFHHYQMLANELVRRPAVKLVVVDPAGAYVGGVDDHKDAELRQLLGPLADLAAEAKVSLVLVKHLNKGADARAIHRVTGSVAWVNAARAAYLIAAHPDDEERRVFIPIKGNLTRKPRGREFQLRSLAREEALHQLGAFQHLDERDKEALAAQLFCVQWLGDSDMRPEDALVTQRRERSTKVEECATWVKEFLKGFAWPDDEVEAAAKNAGHTFDNYKRAKTALRAEGLASKPRGFSKRWWIGFGNPKEWKDRPAPVSAAVPEQNQTAETAQTAETGGDQAAW